MALTLTFVTPQIGRCRLCWFTVSASFLVVLIISKHALFHHRLDLVLLSGFHSIQLGHLRKLLLSQRSLLFDCIGRGRRRMLSAYYSFRKLDISKIKENSLGTFSYSQHGLLQYSNPCR